MQNGLFISKKQFLVFAQPHSLLHNTSTVGEIKLSIVFLLAVLYLLVGFSSLLLMLCVSG